MSKFIFATDLHLTDRMPVNRVTSIYPACINKLDYILNFAKTLDIPNVIMGGDLFDSPCPSYDLYGSVVNTLKKYKDQTVHTAIGNHDALYGNINGTALGALLKSGFIKNESSLTLNEFFIKFYNYERNISLYKSKDKYVLPEAKTLKGKINISVVHNSIVTSPVIYEHMLYTDIETMDDVILCGHIHEQFYKEKQSKSNTGKTIFVNPGCITRIKTNERNIVPSIVLVENTDVLSVKILSFKDMEILTNVKAIDCSPSDFRNKDEDSAETSFTKAVDEAKIEIDDISAYIMSSSADEETKKESIRLIDKYKVKKGE